MNLRSFLSLILAAMAVLAAACAPVAPVPVIPTMLNLPVPAVTAQPPVAVEPTALPPATAPTLSFQPANYAAAADGFELLYPSDWTAVPIDTIGSRGSQGLLLSPGSSAETLAEGGTRMAMTVYLWDPKNDLPAFVDHRKQAWQSSGFTIVKDASGQLGNGNAFNSFVIQTPDNHQAFFLFTTLGEKYLEISGEGNLALIEEIALTLR